MSAGRPDMRAIIHHHEQRTTHRRAGAAHTRLAGERDASFLVRVLLLHGQGCVSLTHTGRPFGVGTFSKFDGIGKRLTAPRRQPHSESTPDALLMGTDPDFVGAFVAALRSMVGLRNRTRTPGGDE